MPDNRGDPMPPLDDKFLKERYDYELERKEKLESALAFPASILIVLGSLALTMLRGFSFTKAASHDSIRCSAGSRRVRVPPVSVVFRSRLPRPENDLPATTIAR